MEQPRWLSSEESEMWMRLLAVATLLPMSLEAQLKRDSGTTFVEYTILAMLSDSPEHALPMTELAYVSQCSPSRASHIVGRLEDRGWLERTASESDGRSVTARLTEAGMAHLVATAPGHVEQARSTVFDVLDDRDVAQLRVLLDKLIAPLDPEGRLPL